MVELRTDGTEVTISGEIMIEPGYALFHVLDIPEPCLLHKHLGTEAAKTGPSTNFEECDSGDGSKAETALKLRSDVSKTPALRGELRCQDSSSGFMIASRPVVSESHMEVAIDQGSPCHLISSFGLARLVAWTRKANVENDLERITERMCCAFLIAAKMSLFRAYPATGS